MIRSILVKLFLTMSIGATWTTGALAQSFFEDEKCAIIVASRKTEGEVRGYIEQNSSMGDFYVFLSNSGWYAISLGVINLGAAPDYLERHKASGKIPRDSYCSTGKKYVRQVQMSPTTQGSSSQRQAGQTASSTNSEMAEWVERSCPRSIGPSLYASCTAREWGAINRPGWPDMDGLSTEQYDWVLRSCPYSIGPNLWRSCAERELAALQSNTWPNLDLLSDEERAWILETCPRSIGPALMKACLAREYSAFVEPSPKPTIKVPVPTPQPSPSPQADRRPDPAPTVTTTSALPRWTSVTLPRPSSQRAAAESAEVVYRKVAPSVYKIFSAASDAALRDMRNVSQGSAVAVTDNLAFTNCHVVENGRYHVLLDETSETLLEVNVIAADQDRDVCVVYSNLRELKPIERIRSTANLSVGEAVYTIGNPSNLSKTIAGGIVSGVRDDDFRAIQITAPISPGSSGGALVDGAGHLIGITTFYLEDAQNLNFAVAIEEFWK